jgi:hypothetical protein
LSQDEEKDASIDAKDATSSSRLQVWRTMDEIAQFTNRDKDYIRNPIDSQKDFKVTYNYSLKDTKVKKKI